MILKFNRSVVISIFLFCILVVIRFFYLLNMNDREFILLRVIRILALSFCGAGVGLSGFVLQNMFRNPIVDIYVLGNASVCILSQIIAFSLFCYPQSYYVSYILSFLLTIFLMYVVYKFSYRDGYFDLVKLLLLSFAINIFVWGVINFSIYNITRLSSINIYHLLQGALEGVYIKEIILQLSGCGFAFICLYLLLDRIWILSVGEEFAITSGVNVTSLKLFIYILISILSTIITQTIGVIPFVGIIIPHFVRVMEKNIYNQFFIILFVGAITLLLSDLFSALVSFSFNLPIFVILNLFAFPFFLYMIFKK